MCAVSPEHVQFAMKIFEINDFKMQSAMYMFSAKAEQVLFGYLQRLILPCLVFFGDVLSLVIDFYCRS